MLSNLSVGRGTSLILDSTDAQPTQPADPEAPTGPTPESVSLSPGSLETLLPQQAADLVVSAPFTKFWSYKRPGKQTPISHPTLRVPRHEPPASHPEPPSSTRATPRGRRACKRGCVGAGLS